MFSQRLKELRKINGYSQLDMAEKLSISAAAYGYYEQGKNNPSVSTLNELADIFNVSTDYLIGRTIFPYDNITESDKVKILAREADGLSDEEIDIIRSVVKKFKENK